MLGDIALVLIFILVGGFFALSEMALVSLREGQIRQLAGRGKRGAQVAALAEDPQRFLAAVQVGVTVAGFFSAAFGAATISERLVPYLIDAGCPESIAATVSLVGTTVAVSYFSLVLGELVPKQLAMQRAEGVATAVGPIVVVLSRFAAPVIWFLSKSSDLVVRLLGGDPEAAREAITQDEIRELVTGHEGIGEVERKIVGDVFAAGERSLREVMIPRTEVDFLDADMPAYRAVTYVADQPHSRYPVVDGDVDNVLGFLHVRDLLDPQMATRRIHLRDLVRPVLTLPGTNRVLPTLSAMRAQGQHMAIVLDEYGGTDGIVTLEDLVEEFVGDIWDEYDQDNDGGAGELIGLAVPREFDGLTNLEDFAERTGCTIPEGPYETVAGYVVASLGRLARVGDTVSVTGVQLTVTALDGRRIARLLATPEPPATPAAAGGEASTATDTDAAASPMNPRPPAVPPVA